LTCGQAFEASLDSSARVSSLEDRRLFLHYELLEILGEGGFGTVWKALDTILGRIVALKIGRVQAHGDLGKQAELIAREARIVAQLQHPGIIPVFETGVAEGIAYISTAYLECQDLKRYLADNNLPLSPVQAAQLCLDLAEALCHAHDLGIIHRDLKPGNILIDSRGVPRITDFGLAKRESGDVTLTLHGQAVGTPAYMSPEQALGESRFIDRRSDLYSLGIILFELLTGQLPYRGDAGTLLLQIITQDPPLLRSIRHTVPPDMETICLKCLEKSPLRRYQTARELADDLSHFLKHEPIAARPANAISRTAKWTRRNPGWASVIFVSMFSLLGVIGGGVIHNLRLSEANRKLESAIRQSETERKLAIMQTKIAETKKAEAELATTKLGARELAARRLLYVNDVRQASEFWERGQLQNARDMLTRHLPPPGEQDLRGFEWFHLMRHCELPSVRTITCSDQPLFCVAISQKGQLLASGGADGTLRIHDVSGRLIRELRGFWGEIECLSFDGQDQYLAVGGNHGVLTLLRVDDWKTEFRIDAHSRSITQLDFTPDSACLVTGSDDSTISFWECPSGALIRQLDCPFTEIESVSISHDGAWLAVSDSDGLLSVRKLPTGVLQWEYRHEQPVRSVRFGRSRTDLVVGCHDGYVRVFQAEVGRPRLMLGNFQEPVQSVTFGDQDRIIVAADKKGEIRFWDSDSGLLRSITHCSGGRVYSLAFSTTESLLASVDRQGCIRIWDPATFPRKLSVSSGEFVRTVSFGSFDSPIYVSHGSRILCLDVNEHDTRNSHTDARLELFSNLSLRWHRPYPSRSVAISHDGKVVAAAHGRNRVALLDAQTGSEKSAFVISPDPISIQSLVFSRDDHSLLAGESPGSVAVYGIREQRCLFRLKPGTEEIWQSLFLNDDTLAVCAGNRMTTVVDLKSQSIKQSDISEIRHLCLAISPDETLAVSGGERGVLTFWKIPGWERVGTLTAKTESILAVAFSPDGKTLGVGTGDHRLTFWNVETLQEIYSIPFFHKNIQTIGFAPSGDFLTIGTFNSSSEGEDLGRIEILHGK